ncbi:MAG: AraC family transcriptional regulator [Imperialibacter sp.]
MSDYITLDSPNVPILRHGENNTIPYGVFIKSPAEADTLPDSELASFKSRDMYLPNFSIREVEGIFSRDVVLKNLRSEGADLPGSCLLMKADVKTYLSGSNQVIATKQASQNFKFDPNNEYRHHIAANSELHYVHVSYAPEYLDSFLPQNEPWADWVREKIAKKERVFGKEYQPLSLAQLRAIQTLTDCPLVGSLGVMMVETSVTQIILLQLHSLFAEEYRLTDKTQSPRRDQDLVHTVKQYLRNNYLEDHSIAGLARQFATNSNKLMLVFKTVEGKSIFEYISDLRMQHAVHLLHDKDVKVSDVARTLGYKNPNHFSTAFKRIYGVVPTEFRYKPTY